MEIEEFSSRLENYLRYGNVNGPKRTIPVTKVSFCPFSAALSIRYDTRFFGEKNSGKILGTVLHEGLLSVIQNSWDYLKGEIEEEPQVEVPLKYDLGNGWMLTGRADLVVGRYIFEFKFLHEYPYERIPSNVDDISDIDDDNIVNAYIEQVNAYLNMMPEAEVGYLWIFKRNELVPWKKIPVKKDEHKFERFLKRAEKIAEIVASLEKGETPEFEPRFSWECGKCIYKAFCPRFR